MKAQTARLHVVFSSLTKTSTGGVGGGLQQRYCSCSLPSRSSRVMVCMAFSVRGNTSSWSASKRSPTKMVNGIPTNLLAASFCRGGMSLQRQTERVCVSGERECVCACVCVHLSLSPSLPPSLSLSLCANDVDSPCVKNHQIPHSRLARQRFIQRMTLFCRV